MLIVLFPMASLTSPVYPVIAATGLIIVAVKFAKRKSERLPANFTYIANIIALIMLAAVVAQMTFDTYRTVDEAAAMAENSTAPLYRTEHRPAPSTLPHIIHIVLDGYSRADVLRSQYGFDNASFLDAIRRRGFRVADRATTPFNQTLLVMHAIFSLGEKDYGLTDLMDRHNGPMLRRIFARNLGHGAVASILRNAGYDLQSTPSAYQPMQWDRIAGRDGAISTLDRFTLPGTYLFTSDMLQRSPILSPLTNQILDGDHSVGALNYRYLKDVPARRFQPTAGRPLFIYQHILAPHPPFNITHDGKPAEITGFKRDMSDGSHLIEDDNRKRDLYRDGYVQKLRYINGAILTQIDNLKKTLSGPMIIILHGDHGGGLHLDQDHQENTCLRERFSPLLAVYASDPRISDAFTNETNIANIYRVIFNTLFNFDLATPENQSNFVSWDIDSTTPLDPRELELACQPNRTWTAQQAPGSANTPSVNSISK